MLKPILFLHRWLGVVVGLLMTLWCLSGFVMMYVDYPRLSAAEQLRGLEPLQLPAPSAFSQADLRPDMALKSARLEMLGGQPVLRITPAMHSERRIGQMRTMPGAVDMRSGKPLPLLSMENVREVALSFARNHALDGTLEAVAETPIDQWTVQAYARNAPLYRADFNDPAATQIYISGKSGEVIQDTTRFQRFWGWLGAVPHWLYPTMLRQDAALWGQVVIWTSLAGCFLTVAGIWAGIARLRRKRDGSIGSPFGGLWWWHHMFGLFFGILTLTWVASGLLSMNPFGFLDSQAGLVERQRLAGDIRWEAIEKGVRVLTELPPGTVRLDTAPLGGRLFFLAVDGKGKGIRYNAEGQPAPLSKAEMQSALAGFKIARLDFLTKEDAYYYSHKFPISLPVWRAQLNDVERSLLYIDATSGQLVRAFDRNARSSRWLQNGLHSLDLPILRQRPVWDLLVVPLLAMVTAVCATGTWMAWRLVARDIRRLRRRTQRRWSPAFST